MQISRKVCALCEERMRDVSDTTLFFISESKAVYAHNQCAKLGRKVRDMAEPSFERAFSVVQAELARSGYRMELRDLNDPIRFLDEFQSWLLAVSLGGGSRVLPRPKKSTV